MTQREDKIKAACKIINEAIGRLGDVPEGAARFYALYFTLEREAQKIISEPALTKKATI